MRLLHALLCFVYSRGLSYELIPMIYGNNTIVQCKRTKHGDPLGASGKHQTGTIKSVLHMNVSTHQ